MDFISAMLGMDMSKLVQFGYILLLVYMMTIHMPRREKVVSKERADREEAFKTERAARDTAFLDTINSYRDALVSFQEKEDASHASIIQMVSTHDQKTREGHKQMVRILRAIADKLDTKLYED